MDVNPIIPIRYFPNYDMFLSQTIFALEVNLGVLFSYQLYSSLFDFNSQASMICYIFLVILSIIQLYWTISIAYYGAGNRYNWHKKLQDLAEGALSMPKLCADILSLTWHYLLANCCRWPYCVLVYNLTYSP